MRKLLIRSVLSVLAFAVLAVAWLAAGPWWARGLDAIHTTRLATATSFSIRKFSGAFQFVPGRDGAPLPEAEGFTSWDWGNPLELVGIRLDPGGVLVLTDGDRHFVLGRCPCAVEDHGYTPEIAPEPGDTTSITLDRGMTSWPTPGHATCCGSLGGGGSWYPWARYLYWHLSWTKADGARLDMLARFRQNYESRSGWMDPGAASLVRLDIRPARRDRRTQLGATRPRGLTSLTDIVGGGSAGSILASRLSARSTNQVLLCEAGEDTPDGRVPEAILDSRSGFAAGDPRFVWSRLRVTTEAMPHNDPDAPRPRLVRYEQARVLGGGSSINGQLANRGAPHDYDEWEQRGASGWRWETVLPYFKKIERDIDFDGQLHGSDGRIPVRRVFPENWSDYAKAVAAAFTLAGYRYLPDQNGEFQDGYYPLAMSNLYDRRVSAAVGYLGPTVRQRSNLDVITEAPVSELLFEDTCCVGIRAMVDGKPAEFRANEVILCCGAIHSPAMLLRAGIGPVGHLRDLGIAVRAARAGVGQRLMDHPSISVSSFLKPNSRKNPYSKRSLHVGMRFSSGIEGAPAGDMALTVSNKSAWHAIGDRIAVITLWVNKTFSEAGQVQLSSTDWHQEPRVDFNLLSDHRDLMRLAKGFREIAALHDLPPLKAVTSDVFPASFTDKIRKVGTYNTKNRILTRIGATVMDGPAFLRQAIIRGFIMENAGLVRALHDDETLETYIRRAAVGVWHCSCSCRMGAEDDPMAVTDNQGRVRGVHGLRVVDASIFPVVPCANTNFPTMMAAEKIADDILAAEPSVGSAHRLVVA